MKEQLVTLETAKLAKEKGFKIETREGYLETVEHTVEMRGGDCTFPYQAPRILSSRLVDEYTTLIALAPTQSLLQKWLRDTHHIIAEARFLAGGKRETAQYETIVYGNFEEDDSEESCLYNRFEDALEDSLMEGLKSIK
jgi:hypothetical protein